jgi:hypothetical protein
VKPEKQSCADAPAAAFSPREKLVVTSSCGATRTWPIADPAVSTLIGKDPGIRTVSFDPSGSRILTVGANGVNLRPTHQSAGQTEVFSDRDGRQAQFSWDSTSLVVAEANGTLNVFDARTLKQQNAAGFTMSGVSSLQFSEHAPYFAARSDLGAVWLQDLNGRAWQVPRPRSPRDDSGVDLWGTIEMSRIPHGPDETPIQSVGLSDDGRYVVAGYKDGTVGIHAGMNPPAGRPFRVDDEVLLADHQFDDKALSIMALWYLQQLNGGPRNLHYGEQKLVYRPSDLRVGSGKPVTRERVFNALHQIIRSAEVGSAGAGAVLVVYVAAHGWLGPDGRKYFLPSDAVASEPGTWIGFDEFLKPIRDFVSVFAPNRAAIVVFDTCQVRLGSAAQSGNDPLKGPEGLVVIESTSPGEYAWHWTGHMDSSVTRTTVKKKWRSTRNGKPVESAESTTVSARMSIFPIASQWALSSLIDAKRTEASPDERVITIDNWIFNVQSAMKELLRNIPDVAKTGHVQEIQSRNPDGGDFDLFEVERNGRK